MSLKRKSCSFQVRPGLGLGLFFRDLMEIGMGLELVTCCYPLGIVLGMETMIIAKIMLFNEDTESQTKLKINTLKRSP